MAGNGGDAASAENWLRRARGLESRQKRDPAGIGSAAVLRPRDAGRGWDPYDVWLHRVELPRRRHKVTGGGSPE